MDVQTLRREDLVTLLGTDDPAGIAACLPFCDDDADHPSLEDLGRTEIGQGACAVIITHPTDADKVVRICEEGDGWVVYACGGGADHGARPRVFALGWTGACWVAVTERLELALLAEAQIFLDDVRAALVPNARPVRTPSAIAVAQDALTRGLDLDDLEPRNVMKRGTGEIVLNDPLGVMMADQMQAMKAVYTVIDADAPSP